MCLNCPNPFCEHCIFCVVSILPLSKGTFSHLFESLLSYIMFSFINLFTCLSSIQFIFLIILGLSVLCLSSNFCFHLYPYLEVWEAESRRSIAQVRGANGCCRWECLERERWEREREREILTLWPSVHHLHRPTSRLVLKILSVHLTFDWLITLTFNIT